MDLCYKTLGDRQNSKCEMLVDPHLERYLNAEGSIISANFSSRLDRKSEYILYIYIYMHLYVRGHLSTTFPPWSSDTRFVTLIAIEMNFLLRDRALLFPFLLSSRDPITPRVNIQICITT